MTIGIIFGSIRDGRAGESVGHWVVEQSQNREFVYTLIDLKEFDVPLMTSATVPMAANKQYDDERVNRWSEAIDACEGFVFVTPEYNHSVPGAFKNAFDSLGAEWAKKPVAFVGYGAAGGVRAVEAWRLATANFSMPDVRNQLDLNLFTEFGAGGFEPTERRVDALKAVFEELEDLVRRYR